MGCLKGKNKVKHKEAKYKCKKCGATSNNKKDICKIKKNKKDKDSE